MSMVGMAIVMARRCGRSGAEELEVLLSAGSVNDNHVVQVKADETDGHFALQIGAGQRKAKPLTKPELGHIKPAGVPLKQHLAEFPVTEDAILPVGTEISVRHLRPGLYVDIAGNHHRKGFHVRTNSQRLQLVPAWLFIIFMKVALGFEDSGQKNYKHYAGVGCLQWNKTIFRSWNI